MGPQCMANLRRPRLVTAVGAGVLSSGMLIAGPAAVALAAPSEVGSGGTTVASIDRGPHVSVSVGGYHFNSGTARALSDGPSNGGTGNVAIALGRGSTATAGGGNNNTAIAIGVNSHATAINGNKNRATASGLNSSAFAGNGNGNQATARGNNNRAQASQGDNNIASVTNGNNSTADAGCVGPSAPYSCGFDNNFGSGNTATVSGSRSEARASRGTGNTATVSGDDSSAIADVGNNTAVAVNGTDSKARAFETSGSMIRLTGDSSTADITGGSSNEATVDGTNSHAKIDGGGSRNSVLVSADRGVAEAIGGSDLSAEVIEPGYAVRATPDDPNVTCPGSDICTPPPGTP